MALPATTPREGEDVMPNADALPGPGAVSPMLAVAGPLPPNGAGWAYELKWDGVRALVRVEGGTLRVHSRNGVEMTTAYPELHAIAAECGPALLDGEIVAFDEAQRPSFPRLQKRMHVTDPRSAGRLARTDPVVLLLFDVLHLDGRPLIRRPYAERRAELDRLTLVGPAWQTPPVFDGAGTDAVRFSQQQRLEGVVAKRIGSPYLPGRRSPDWVKVKNIRTQEVVIGGWRPGAGHRSATIGALLVGIPGVSGLVYAGKVGTGFTDQVLADLHQRLVHTARTANPFSQIHSADARDARWVAPELVGEVEFTEWTTDGRFRHPSWRGLRPDKSAAEVARE